MNNEKISYIEATFLVIAVAITHIILNMPNALIESEGSASILNIIYITALVIIFFLIVEKLFRPFEGGDILDVSEFVGGKTLKIVVSVVYTVYLIFVSSILLRNFVETLRVTYYPNSSAFALTLVFILCAVIVNKIGEKNVIKVNTLLLPLVLISVVVIFTSSIGKFQFERIFPILGHGFKATFILGSSNIYAFGGLIYLFLIRTHLKDYTKYKKVGVIAIIVSSLYLLLSVASLLLLFPFLTAGKDVLSVYLSTRTIEFGKVFQRSDAIFILIWIFAFLSYLSVIILYITKISKKCLPTKNSSPFIYISAIFILISSLISQNTEQLRFIETVLFKYIGIGIVFVFSFIILLIGYIKKKPKLYTSFLKN